MLFRLKISSLILFLILASAGTLATQSTKHVDHIGSEDGLVSQLCQHLIEDDCGNLWITSFLDIQKYDGHNVTVFPIKNVTDSESGGIMDLHKDKNGNIWIISGITSSVNKNKYVKIKSEYYINIIDPITNTIKKFSDIIDDHELKEEDILDLNYIDGTIYLITKNNTIYRYTDKLEFYSNTKDLDKFLLIDKFNNLVYFENNEINHYSKNGDLIATIDSSQISNIQNISISNRGQIFFIAKDEKKFVISEHNGRSLIPLRKISVRELNNKNRRIYRVTKYKDGSMLINDRLFYKQDTTYFELKGSDVNKPVFAYLVGESGLSFIATNLGVYVLEEKKKFFKQLANNDQDELNSVRGILIDERIEAYRTSSEQEIIKSKTENLSLDFLEDKNLGPLAAMHYIDPTNNNHLWSVGYIKSFVRKIDLEKKEYHYYNFQPSHTAHANNILRSRQSNRLYFANNKGLFILNESSNQIDNVILDCINNKNIEVNQIVEYNDVLLLASSIGLIYYDESENKCQLFPVVIDSISYKIQFIHKDNIDSDKLWLCATRGGIVEWDTKTNSVINIITTQNGLSNNDVHAIMEDGDQRLWVSSNRNLNSIDKTTGTISIYTENDGISHSEFNRFSFFYDSTYNHIYLGGLNGYTYFNPDSIPNFRHDNKIKLRVLDAFKTREDAVIENYHSEILQTNTIVFEQSDVSVNINLATNHVANAKEKQYSYRIPGLIDNWTTQSSNQIKLTRLPYGDYKLEVIADLFKPNYSSNILSIDLTYPQPIFDKTWFRLLLLLISGLLIWLAVQQYLKRIKQQNKRLEQAIADRTLELRELNEKKSKLFAILAHDLRNPITSLTDIADKIKFLSKNNRLEEIDIVAEQTKDKLSALDDNLNNILMWALTENKTYTQSPEKLSLKLEIKKIVNLYSTPIIDKKIKTIYGLEVVDQVFLDVRVLQTILRNIISNALKFSPPDSQISFIKSYEDDDRICLLYTSPSPRDRG